MVSRDEAKTIAERELRDAGDVGQRWSVYKVLAGSELGQGRVNVYTSSPINWDKCWVAYIDRHRLALESSFVIVISMVDGSVLYAGSAGDEG